MADFNDLFSYLRIILFGFIVLIACIYSIPILFLRRFHYRNNILTLNICLATICCSLYWFLFYIMLETNLTGTYNFLLNTCVFVFIVPTILTLQVPLSFVTISINLSCAVLYHNINLFKTKQWIFICILFQWLFGIIFTLPIVSGIKSYCATSRWVEIYKLILIVIIPSIIFLITNILIYIKVHSSFRRVQPILSVTENNSNNNQQVRISRRDIHLLRHMILMYCIFVGGWFPLYLLLAIYNQFEINPIESACFTIWCQLALLCNIIDLYLYNKRVRNYLKTSILRCFHW